MKKKALGIASLATFPSMETCEASKPHYPSFDLAYLDKNIEGSSWDLDTTIAYLKTKGVKKVIIASGETEEELRKHPAVKKADGISTEKIPTTLQV